MSKTINDIGFLSTRFAGTDGVSLEASKWAKILKQSGYNCFWCSGASDKNPSKSYVIPEANFKYRLNRRINEKVLENTKLELNTRLEIENLSLLLEKKILNFISRYKIDLLIIENALTIPMHIPLGVGIKRAIEKTNIPTIAHHHDFYWERKRYNINSVGEYLLEAFPPNLPSIKHVVINSKAQRDLKAYTGNDSVIIPNVMDFENPPQTDIKKSRDLMSCSGVPNDSRIFLQPTRIVERKGIEYAFKIIKDIRDKGLNKSEIVISHESGDEGYSYEKSLKKTADELGIKYRKLKKRLSDPWNPDKNPQQQNEFSLADVYPASDFVLYPSLYEGFGNALIEAFYYKKPVVANEYQRFKDDIKPKGVDVISIDIERDNGIKDTITEEILDVLHSPIIMERMVEHNYQVGRKHFSFEIARDRLKELINPGNGSENQNLEAILQ